MPNPIPHTPPHAARRDEEVEGDPILHDPQCDYCGRLLPLTRPSGRPFRRDGCCSDGCAQAIAQRGGRRFAAA